MDKDALIYVAGHRGLVGSAIVRALQAAGYTRLLTRTHAELDLTDAGAVQSFFREHRPDYVFLAAARVGGILANKDYPAEFIRDNLAIQTNVIHAAWQAGVRRLLFLGSSCIYPRDCPQPIREEYLLTGPLEATNRPYAVAKIAGIEMCWAYNRQYGTHYLAVMPTNLYGPGDNFDLERSHVLPAMIRKFHLGRLALQGDSTALERDEALHGPIPPGLRARLRDIASGRSTETPVTLWGSGSPRREFLHSDDMADACLFLMQREEQVLGDLAGPEGNHPPLINIGCGEDQTIAELAEQVQTVVGYTGPITFDASKPDGTPRKLLDVSRLSSLGWHPRIELPAGLAGVYQRYLQAGQDR